MPPRARALQRFMDPTNPDEPNPSAATDPRVTFAAERTLLAWVRTGLALMGFGFVVARFGLFLRELAAARDPATAPAGHPGRFSLWAGTGLVLIGVLVNGLAAAEHVTRIRRLR